jgi:hypothetical protein
VGVDLGCLYNRVCLVLLLVLELDFFLLLFVSTLPPSVSRVPYYNNCHGENQDIENYGFPGMENDVELMQSGDMDQERRISDKWWCRLAKANLHTRALESGLGKASILCEL